MNILATICAAKRLEVARQQEQQPLPYLKQQIGRRQQRGSSLRQALLASPHGVIAEFKRRSPSKGWISPDADVEAVVSGYEQAGAAAISCLTDEPFFGGAFADFDKARRCLTRAPLLRKEF
ncbi:MAG: indole-3-glycerol-phosphate synthase TrpC, partial [Prevotellaceae bacterium]|nr:indole-3-glycerol-phosphate synthase TrpC [Prevotellaceae bacterium]